MTTKAKPRTKGSVEGWKYHPLQEGQKRQYFFLQLSANDKDPEQNDYIGPFECPPAAKAHAMVYGPHWAFIVLLEKLPPAQHLMDPGDHKRFLYGMIQAKAKEAAQADSATSTGEAERAAEPESADIPETPESRDIPDTAQ